VIVKKNSFVMMLCALGGDNIKLAGIFMFFIYQIVMWIRFSGPKWSCMDRRFLIVLKKDIFSVKKLALYKPLF
jgi:hypothetical protein